MIRRSIKNLRKSFSFRRNSRQAEHLPSSSEDRIEAESSSNIGEDSAEAFPIDQLPEEIIANILKLVSGVDIIRCLKVSRKFNLVINRYKLLDHNVFYIECVSSYAEADVVQFYMRDLWKNGLSYIGFNMVSKYNLSNGNLIPFLEGEEPIVDFFYNPDVPNAGEEFLKRILSMARIGYCTMQSHKHNPFLERFYQLACETRCPIEQLNLGSIHDVEKCINLLQSLNFHNQQTTLIQLDYDFNGFTKSEWNTLQELAALADLRFGVVPFKRFLLLLMTIIENWLNGIVHNGFKIICAQEYDYSFKSSGELMRPYFYSSDMIIEGISLKEIRKMEYNADLPDSFRIMKTSDKSYLNFARIWGDKNVFVVTPGVNQS